MSYWDDYRDEVASIDDEESQQKKLRPKKKEKLRPKKKEKLHLRRKKVKPLENTAGIRPGFTVNGIVDLAGVKSFGDLTLTRLHSEASCAGRYCVVHNPSRHHMRDLPLIWNAPLSRMERLCEHDITHPDPDDLRYWVEIVKTPVKGLHSCCRSGCCTPEPPKKK